MTFSPTKGTAIARAARKALPVAVAVAGAGLGTALAGTAHAAATTDMVKVAASDDAYSSSSRQNLNTGKADKLVAGRLNGDSMVTFLKFTVDKLPNGASLKGAKVSLTRESNAALPPLKLAKVSNTSWTEASITAKNDPALGAVVSTVTPKASDATVTFDVSSVVKGAGTYTFAVTAGDRVARFRSAESGNLVPALDLTVTSPAKPVTQKPATPKPTTPKPATPADPEPTTPGNCTVDAKLVPTCGLLWGAAAGGFSETPRDEALKTWEAKSGRNATVYHTYHRGNEMFPTKDEIAMARDPKNPRILMLNWKVAYGTKWANVAKGEQDARIDKLSAHIKANFSEKFFMVLHHEPENDVNPAAGSGMTAKDYAAMFRHTVKRMKANGVSNAIFMVAYMNYEKWNNSSWWADLYPGDDAVDWVAVDTYNNAQPGGFHNGDFTYLMNRTNDKAKFPGWYTWATTKHPGKPIMVAEWGIYDSSTKDDGRNTAKILDTVLPQLSKMPAIKGLVYFDTAKDQHGHDIRIDATPEGLAAFKRLAADPRWNVKVGK